MTSVGLERLGFEWTAVHNGTVEIAGDRREVITAFNRLRAQILEEMAQRGEYSAQAA